MGKCDFCSLLIDCELYFVFFGVYGELRGDCLGVEVFSLRWDFGFGFFILYGVLVVLDWFFFLGVLLLLVIVLCFCI